MTNTRKSPTSTRRMMKSLRSRTGHRPAQWLFDVSGKPSVCSLVSASSALREGSGARLAYNSPTRILLSQPLPRPRKYRVGLLFSVSRPTRASPVFRVSRGGSPRRLPFYHRYQPSHAPSLPPFLYLGLAVDSRASLPHLAPLYCSSHLPPSSHLRH